MWNVTMLCAIVAAFGGTAVWLAQVQDAATAVDDDNAAVTVIDGYRPAPDWMHHRAPAGPLPRSPLHNLTTAGVATTLAGWTPLP
jgi:hypothetical protein